MSAAARRRIGDASAHDAHELDALMSRVIAHALGADAAVLSATLENVRANLEWSMANPDRCCHLTCTVDETLAGVILVKHFWNLCSLFVAPELQRAGIGRELMLASIERCRGRSDKNALWLNAATNAVAFYERLGFTERASAQPLPAGFRAMQLGL
ncbi:MAG TPA: GNAT family N-acetyltransferase [Albitalea sp.]|uniref:GNAT family N-acetyltransferase n=1 Tax=Piscinibacter sp. TaxID=1903157 RepID=UPI002ED4BDEC